MWTLDNLDLQGQEWNNEFKKTKNAYIFFIIIKM